MTNNDFRKIMVNETIKKYRKIIRQKRKEWDIQTERDIKNKFGKLKNKL